MLHDFAVFGTPVSLQTKKRKNLQAWQDIVAEAARNAVPEDDILLYTEFAVVLVYFHFDEMQGDIDNIAKPILDGMAGPVYHDDKPVSQLTVRRTNLDRAGLAIEDPPPTLAGALERAYKEREDFVYIRIDDAPDHSRLP